MSPLHLVLCSKSPRRSQLLKKLGYDFTTCVSNVVEQVPSHLMPDEKVIYLSNMKADNTPFDLDEKTVVIAADTMVFLGNDEMGKPRNENEAKVMLKLLSGNTHQVITGVTIKSINEVKSFYSKTTVSFEDMGEEIILDYINEFQPFDKAGSYGIQDSMDENGKSIGPLSLKIVQGDYYNVMGLPIHQLKLELENFLKS
jgi:septum formation protein